MFGAVCTGSTVQVFATETRTSKKRFALALGEEFQSTLRVEFAIWQARLRSCALVAGRGPDIIWLSRYCLMIVTECGYKARLLSISTKHTRRSNGRLDTCFNFRSVLLCAILIWGATLLF